jgi:RNA polymerase sigma factor (sigma-70 family)
MNNNELEIEYELIKQAKNCDKAAKTALIKKCSGLVFNVSSLFVGRGIEREELIQEGYLGVLRAVEAFNQRLNNEKGFLVFAKYYVKAAMRKYILNHSRLIKLPQYLVEEVYHYLAIEHDFIKKYNVKPSDEEIAKNASLNKNVTAERVRYIKNLHVSSSYCIYFDTDDEVNMKLVDDIFDLYDQACRIEMEKEAKEYTFHKVRNAIKQLPNTHKRIIELHFGFNNCEPRSMQKVAKAMGMNLQKATHIKTEAIKLLKKIMTNK